MTRLGLALAAIAASIWAPPMARADEAFAAADNRIPIHVVVITAFEVGNDTGDVPGEFQNWVEKLPLPTVLPFPQGYHPLRYNAQKQVLGMVAGEGPGRMASSITAIANDPRFDLSRAYWLLVGIAGIDPNFGSAGSVAWAEYIIDGDLGFEIDAREIPNSWSTGYVPFGRSIPYEKPTPPVDTVSGANLFHLNPGITAWAYRFSKSHATLQDTDNLRTFRAKYTGFPKAQEPPQIRYGDTMAAGTWWIGARLNEWAEKWTKYWSKDKAVFATTAEEDAAFAQALTFLAQAKRVDFDRAIVLRGGSDYSVPYPGQSPAQLLHVDATGDGLSSFIESVNNIYDAASPVVNELATHWDKYRDGVR